MTKEEAIKEMIIRIEEIERERLASHLSIDPNRQKKEAVNSILKALREVVKEDADQ